MWLERRRVESPRTQFAADNLGWFGQHRILI